MRYEPVAILTFGNFGEEKMKRGTLLGILIFGIAAIGAGTASFAAAGSAEGQTFYGEKCRVCHSLAGDAGKMADKGGPLDGVGAKRDEAWMRAYLSDPKSKMPDAKMPKIKMTDQQLDDVVAYMMSLKAPAK